MGTATCTRLETLDDAASFDAASCDEDDGFKLDGGDGFGDMKADLASDDDGGAVGTGDGEGEGEGV